MKVASSIIYLEEGYKCPITLEVPEIPVKTVCGHVFDKVPLLHFLAINPTCPMCRADVNQDELTNLALRVERVANQAVEPDNNRPEPQLIHAEIRELVAASNQRVEIEAQLEGREAEAELILLGHKAEVANKILQLYLKLTC